MAKDIVCAEAELSIAANNLVEYADFYQEPWNRMWLSFLKYRKKVSRMI